MINTLACSLCPVQEAWKRLLLRAHFQHGVPGLSRQEGRLQRDFQTKIGPRRLSQLAVLEDIHATRPLH